MKNPQRLFSILATICVIGGGSAFAESPRFFAMNTIARDKPDKVVPLLKELGYDGLGGQAGDESMARALKAEGLQFFNGYLTLSLSAEKPALDGSLKQKIDAMRGYHSALWIALEKVSLNGTQFPKSSPVADEIALGKLREIADYAASRDVKVALYPHANFWLERVDDAIRLADKMNRSDVGVTFNLCHWLKVEGVDRDPGPVLKVAMPRLRFVTINGADTGDTKQMGWDRLIQPLDRGTYDVGAFVKMLIDLGYSGPFGFQGYGIKEDPRAVLARTMNAWEKLTQKKK